MTRPAVTVAIPFHNEERHLEQAVRSILRQTFEDFELLLVDDGSTDRSLAVARSFTDPRIVVVADGKHRGLPARLNEIVDRARGDLIARMDADDVSHPTRLAKQVAYLGENATVDVLGSWCALVDDDDEPFAVLEAHLPPSPRDALAHGVMAHPAIVARRSWHLRNRYDESLTRSEDRDLWVRTATTARFAIIDEPLYVMRVEVRRPGFVERYLKSQVQNRVILAKYGPASIGRRATFRLQAATFGKAAAMRVAHALRLASWLVRRRGRPPTAREMATIREALASADQRP
jgi:glycosyltransferase involved in cell wall biosynthesis